MKQMMFNLWLFISFTAASQPLPVEITFLEAQPLWEHKVRDTNYYDVGVQPAINTYTTLHPAFCERYGDELVMYHQAFNYRAEFYGFVMEKININTGEIIWQHYSTYYNDSMQELYRGVRRRSDGHLELNGVSRLGPWVDEYAFGWWNIGGRPSGYTRKIVDFNSGELVQSRIGRDTLFGSDFVPQNMIFFPRIQDSFTITTHISFIDSIDFIDRFTDFYYLDKNQDLSPQNPLKSIFHLRGYSTFSFQAHPYLFGQIGNERILGLFFKDRAQGADEESKLVIYDISDPYDITVLKEVNTTDVIPIYRRDYSGARFGVVDSLYYFTQAYRDTVTAEWNSAVTAFDREGEVVHYLPSCQTGTHTYRHMFMMDQKPDYTLFAAQPSSTGRYGLDFVRIPRGVDSIQYISSLTSAEADESFAVEMQVCTIYHDGLVIIGAYSKSFSGAASTAVKYYAFRAEDLGLDVVSTTGESRQAAPLHIYPNPANDVLIVELEGVTTGEIRIWDLLGHLQIQSPITGMPRQHLDISTLPAGMYLAQTTWPAGFSEVTSFVIMR